MSGITGNDSHYSTAANFPAVSASAIPCQMTENIEDDNNSPIVQHAQSAQGSLKDLLDEADLIQRKR